MPRHLPLFVFVDALGWEILRRHPDFLAGEAPHRSRLESVFGYSSTCDPTIITGLMPEDHGHFSFFVYDPPRSPFAVCRWLRLLPRSVTSRGRVRRMMSRAIRRYYGFTGYFQIYNMPFEVLPLFDYSEKRDLYQPGGINSGAETIFDILRARRIPFHLSDWQASEERNVASLRAAIRTGEPRFAYLYMASMDALLHADGTGSERATRRIAWYHREIASLLADARERYDTVHLHVFSDHGMTDVRECCDLIPRIRATGLEFGKDYAAVYDSTMARFWFLREGARERIEAALREVPQGRILGDEDFARYRCRFAGNRYGELFFLLNPGVLLCPSFLGEKPLAGMHGYAPEHKDTDAAFLTNVAGLEAPRRLDGIFPLMLAEAERASP